MYASGTRELLKAGTKNYVIVSIDAETRKKAVVTAAGRCGLLKMKRFLKNDEYQFGAFRVTCFMAGGNTEKLVYFTWMGPSVAMKTKLAASALRQEIKTYFQGTHLDLEFIGDLDQINEDLITQKIKGSMGSHVPLKYQIGTGDDTELDDDEIAAIEAENARLAELERLRLEEEARIAAEIKAAEEAAAEAERQWQKKLKMLPTRQQTVLKRAPSAVSTIEGYDFSALSDIGANEALMDLDGPLAWIVLSVPEPADVKNDPRIVHIDGSGSGGLEETIACLKEDAIQYGVIRVTGIERRGKTASLRARLVYFIWSGSRVSPKIRKWNAELNRIMLSYFTGITADISIISDQSSLNHSYIADKLKAFAPQGTEHKFGFYNKAEQIDDYLGQLETVPEQLARSVFISPGKNQSNEDGSASAAVSSVSAEEAPVKTVRAESEVWDDEDDIVTADE